MEGLKPDENTFITNQEDEVVYNGDIREFKQYNDSMESYINLMNTFLNRKQKRKLSRYKGFKSFTDRIYGR